MGMKFLGEGPTHLLPPPSSSSSHRGGFDLDSAELWVDPDDGSTQGDDPVEGVRMAMLRHQHVFRSQLFELHRLYWTQKSLMNGFPYDHQPANQNDAAFDWPAATAAVQMMPMPSVAAKPKATATTTQDRSSISSHHTQLNFLPGWNVDGPTRPPPPPYAFNSKLPHHEWLTASEFQLFHDYHTAASRDTESRCFQPQPTNRSAAWSCAVAVKPEPVDLTFCTAPNGSTYHNVDKRTVWGRLPIGKPQPSLITGPKEVINLDDSSSSDSDEVNRGGEAEEEAARPTAASCFRTPPPACGSEVSRQESRLPKLFDMNHMLEEQGVDHYDTTGHSVNMQPGITETNVCKPEKTVLFDLNTIQYEDSHALINEVENNVSSSSAGSSVVVNGVANDGCASMEDFRLGFGNMRREECSTKIEVETVKGVVARNLENNTRAKVASTESDNAQSSAVAGSRGIWNRGRSDANPMALGVVPSPKFLLELNSLPDEDVEDEVLVPCSNGSSSRSQAKLQCLSSSRYPSNLVDPSSDSRVTSSITDCLPAGGSHQPSLESTNLPSAVGRDMGTIAKGVEGERSEEDTVSSRMHRISSCFQDDRSNCSLEQKQGGQHEACAFRNEPQGNNGMLIDLFRHEDEALISDIDGQATEQQRFNRSVTNACSSPSVDTQQHGLAGVGGSVSLVNNPRSCYHGLHRRDGGDNNIHSKPQDMDKDLMILTAAETLAHIFNTRGGPCTSGFPDDDAVVVRPQCEEMECDAQPECSYDSLELIVLALPESQEDECSSPANNSNNLSVETATATENSSSGLRFNTRRGRQLRDFQKDILPGIVSLSRHEICEDMHAFTEIVKFEELKSRGGRLGRWGANRGSRGSFVRKKRSRTSAYVQRR